MRSDLFFRFLLMDKHAVDVLNGCRLLFGARDEDDTVSLKAFPLSDGEKGLFLTGTIEELTAKPIASQSTLSESKFNEAALSGKHFNRKFAAILACHCSLQGFHERRRQATVVFEGLGTIMYSYSCPLVKGGVKPGHWGGVKVGQ